MTEKNKIYIGGDFELDIKLHKKNKGDNFEHFFKLKDNHCYFSSGRESLSFILKNIDSTYKTILMPDYACWDTLGPLLLKNGFNWKIYHINTNFTPELFDKQDGIDAILFINYFGICDYTKQAEYFRNRFPNVELILDNVPALFDLKNNGQKGNWADWQFYSFRKFLPLPGGGLVLNKKKHFDSTETIKTIYDKNWEYAANLRHNFLKGEESEGNEEEYMRLFEQARIDLINGSEIISALTFKYINSFPLNYYNNKRIENYNYLSKKLIDIKWLSECKSNISIDKGPHFLPIIVKNCSRDALRSHLANNNIFCPIHWPNWRNDSFLLEHKFGTSMLSLPIDQRYTKSDMSHLINTIRNFKP